MYKQVDFNSLPDKIKGYICGLWSADGCLRFDSKIVSMSLADYSTLKFIAETLVEPPAKISTRQPVERKIGKQTFTGSEYHCLAITNHSFYQYCLDMGITPRKTYNLNVKLDDKSDEFKWYFLRGAIDGDGCIVEGPNLQRCAIELVSASQVYISYLQSIFGGAIKVSKPLNGGSVPLFRLIFCSNRAKQLANLLPTDSFTMKRKTAKIVELQQVQGKTLKLTRPVFLSGSIFKNSTPLLTEAEENLVALYKSTGNQSIVASQLGLARSTVQTTLKKAGMISILKPGQPKERK